MHDGGEDAGPWVQLLMAVLLAVGGIAMAVLTVGALLGWL